MNINPERLVCPWSNSWYYNFTPPFSGTNMLADGIDEKQYKWYEKWDTYPSVSGFINVTARAVQNTPPTKDDVDGFFKECFPHIFKYVELARKLETNVANQPVVDRIFDLLQIRQSTTQRWWSSVKWHNWSNSFIIDPKVQNELDQIYQKYTDKKD